MKPANIFIVRHGQSQGNADKTIYIHTPDYALLLTDQGVAQARDVGQRLRKHIEFDQFAVYYSPYFRSRQTMDEALGLFTRGQVEFKREEARLREQEWCGRLRGFAEDMEEERDAYGHFYYRFDRGESCADVEDRISDFLSSFNRDFDKVEYPKHAVIFAHGMTNRLFLKRWFHATVEEFERWRNPPNGHIYHLRLIANGRYQLMNPPDLYPEPTHQYQYPFAK